MKDSRLVQCQKAIDAVMQGRSYTRHKSEKDAFVKSSPAPVSDPRQYEFISSNAIKPGHTRCPVSEARSEADRWDNVESYNNWVLEIDKYVLDQMTFDAWLDKMNAALKPVEPLITLKVYSGGKSIHSWISSKDAVDKEMWVKTAIALGKLISDADTSVLYQPNRLVRFPNGARENGKEQTVLEIKEALPYEKIKETLVQAGVWDDNAKIDDLIPQKPNPVVSAEWEQQNPFQVAVRQLILESWPWSEGRAQAVYRDGAHPTSLKDLITCVYDFGPAEDAVMSWASLARKYIDAIPSDTKFAEKFNTLEKQEAERRETQDLACQEGIQAIKSLQRRSRLIHGVAAVREAVDDPFRLARQILGKHFNHVDCPTLRCYRQDWYRWDGKRYYNITESELKTLVAAATKAEFDAVNQRAMALWRKNPGDKSAPVTRKVTISLISNVLQALASMVSVPGKVELPALIGIKTENAPSILSFDNGVLDIKAVISGSAGGMRPHSPCLFNLGSLQFSYNPAATCPRWLAFLQQMLPDADARQLIQEWFGYSLVHDTTYQRFLLMVGEGANGKTVVLTVYHQLLGDGNVSAVSLDGFDGGRTFPLAATLGKLANVIPELGEITRTNEGVLKAFVAGEPIQVERKHREPFLLVPTARLTIATNILPRFADRTDALWRRMLLLPFKVQILDEMKQNRNLVDPKWWRESGELAGVFNWAIEGLRRLRSRGHFVEPADGKEAKVVYRKESNPAAAFLEDHCQADPKGSIPTTQLYRAYRCRVIDDGGQPLAKAMFGREVRRKFPFVNISNPLHIPVGTDIYNKPIIERDRVWEGITVVG